ncbi:hypothetical protein AB0E18_28865, partial [Streptomyces sp. NPDC047968]
PRARPARSSGPRRSAGRSGCPGLPAVDGCPELAELGLLALMEQVLRSGRPRTVKSRRISHMTLYT